jgi:hypothetical protein
VDDCKRYLRVDVARHTRGAELRRAVAALADCPPERVELRLGGVEVTDEQHIEGMGLFGRERELVVVVKDS